MQAYCVKCKAKKEMKDPKQITMKNGRPATQGVCPTCGTKMFRIGKSKQDGRQHFSCHPLGGGTIKTVSRIISSFVRQNNFTKWHQNPITSASGGIIRQYMERIVPPAASNLKRQRHPVNCCKDRLHWWKFESTQGCMNNRSSIFG